MAEQFDSLDGLSDTVRNHTRARVVLGQCSPAQIESVLGIEPHTTPTPDVPPGRGYARLGTGPVLRVQVPTTPDPYDDATGEAQRQTVLDLLPERRTAIEATAPAPEPARTTAVPDPEPAQTTAVPVAMESVAISD